MVDLPTRDRIYILFFRNVLVNQQEAKGVENLPLDVYEIVPLKLHAQKKR